MKARNIAALFLFLCLPIILQAFEIIDQKSLDAANAWLHLVDEGKYKESWEKGAFMLKITVPPLQWQGLMKAMREPLGNLVSRQALIQRPSVNPKNLPQGNYMVIFFKTGFSKKKEAHELVTLVQESDGNWRVLTYQVQ